MTVLIPQLQATLEARIGSDVYGQPTYGHARRIGVAVVRLRVGGKDTSVRADSSASRGWSKEETADAVLLFEARVEPQLGDRVKVRGIALQVVGYHARFDLLGNLAHWQVDLELETAP